MPARRPQQVHKQRTASERVLVLMLMRACREQGDALFCMALLHDNLDNREQANALYIK